MEIIELTSIASYLDTKIAFLRSQLSMQRGMDTSFKDLINENLKDAVTKKMAIENKIDTIINNKYFNDEKEG